MMSSSTAHLPSSDRLWLRSCSIPIEHAMLWEFYFTWWDLCRLTHYAKCLNGRDNSTDAACCCYLQVEKSLQRIQNGQRNSMYTSQQSVENKVGGVPGWQALLTAVGFRLDSAGPGIPAAVFFPTADPGDRLQQCSTTLQSLLGMILLQSYKKKRVSVGNFFWKMIWWYWLLSDCCMWIMDDSLWCRSSGLPPPALQALCKLITASEAGEQLINRVGPCSSQKMLLDFLIQYTR